MQNLVLENVEKNFGAVQVLKSVSLDIEPGEFVVLLGPSGCGKSTLLRIIAGLVDQSSGTLQMGGRSLAGLTPKERNVAFVFQSYALYPHLTVWQNIAFPLVMQGARWWHHIPFVSGIRRRMVSRRPEVKNRVDEVIETLGLGRWADRVPSTLSGGQRQRVALGRAMVREPDLYLMDEPLSNLDAKLRIQLRAELVALHKRVGKTIIYVTHDQAEAMTMGTRIAVMDGGLIQQVGPPKEVYADPANAFVAGFVGNPPMSLLPSVFDAASHTVDIAAAHALPLTAPESWRTLATGAAARRDVLVGVRAEGVRVTGADGLADFTGTVMDVEEEGRDVLVRVAVGSAGAPGALFAGRDTVMALMPAHDGEWVTGQEVGIVLDWGTVMLFDGESGDRIRLDAGADLVRSDLVG